MRAESAEARPAGARPPLRVEVLAGLVAPVADVESFDFWPARGLLRAHVRGLIAREKLPIYCDWKGALRKRWGLTRSVSTLVLFDVEGRVRFAAAGRLDDAQVAALTAA